MHAGDESDTVHFMHPSGHMTFIQRRLNVDATS